MALHCANKNHPDFKQLIKNGYSEDFIYGIWGVYEGNIPDHYLQAGPAPIVDNAVLPQEVLEMDRTSMKSAVEQMSVMLGVDPATQVQFAENLVDNSELDSTVLGKVEKGLLTLRSIGDQVVQRAVMHESFHYVWRYLMDNNYRNRLTKAVNRAYPEVENVEEFLAESFETYQKQSKTLKSFVKKMVNSVLQFVRILPFPKQFIQDTFERTRRGDFAGVGNFSGTEAEQVAYMKFISKNFKTPEEYEMAKDLLLRKFADLRENLGEFMVQGQPVFPTTQDVYDELERYLAGTLIKTREELAALRKSNNATDKRIFENKRKFAKVLNTLIQKQVGAQNKFVYQGIIEDFIPNIDIKTFDIAEEILEDVDSDVPDGIRKETEDVARKDPKDSLSGAVKLLLSTIPELRKTEDGKNTEETGRFIHFNRALIAALKLMDNTYVGNNITVWLKNMVNYITEEDHSMISKAIHLRLKDLIVSTLKPIDKLNEKSAMIFTQPTDLVSAPKYVFVQHKTDPNYDYSDKFLRDIERNAEQFDIVYLSVDPNSKRPKSVAMITEIIKATGVPAKQVIAWYNNTMQTIEARNSLNEFISYVGSMARTEYVITQETRDSKFNTTTKPVKLKESSEHFILKDKLVESIRHRIEEALSEGASASAKLKGQLTNISKQLGDSATVISGIEAFARLFSIDANNVNINKTEIKHNLASLTNFINDLTITLGTSDLVEKDEGRANTYTTEDGVIVTMLQDTVDQVLGNNVGRINDIIKMMLGDSQNIPASPSVTGAKGGKTYLYHLTSHAKRMGQRLRRFFKNEIMGLANKNILPEHFKDKFFTHNIFLNGTSTISEFNIELESMRDKKSKYNTTWLGFSRSDYFKNTFTSFFLNKASESVSKKYYQLYYTPSDKPRPVGALVNVLTQNQINDGIKQTILQLQNHPDSINVKKYTNPEQGIINFDPIKNALATLGLKLSEVTEENMDKVILEVNKEMSKQAVQLAETLLKDDTLIAGKVDMEAFLRMADPNLSKTYADLTGTQAKEFGKEIPLPSTQWNAEASRFKSRIENPHAIFPLVDLFVKNHYVNSYHLTQLVAFSPQFYSSGAQMVKRMSGPNGPGNTGYFRRKEFRALVLNDSKVPEQTITDQMQKLLFGRIELSPQQKKEWEVIKTLFSGIDSTDAQGIMTPRRQAELAEAFGRAYKLSNITKPMYFGPRKVEDAEGNIHEIPTYVKMSSFTLSDDLVAQYPSLARLRAIMEDPSNNIDEIYFDSGVKVGAPSRKNSLTVDDLLSKDLSEVRIPTENVMTLQNESYMMQLNPRSSTDNKLSPFSQMLYFLSPKAGESTNVDTAKQVYLAMSYLYNAGMHQWRRKAANTIGLIRQGFASKIEDAVFEELLDNGLSFNNPMIERKAITQFASSFEKAVVKLKFQGAKLQLQSDIGVTHLGRDLETHVETSNGAKRIVSEVVFPRGVLDPATEKIIEDNLAKGNLTEPDVFGFRIPSTELHSGVVFRIVGFYDSKQTNALIVPKFITAFMGSDFDADALFVAKRPVFKKNTSLVEIKTINGLLAYKQKMQKTLDNFEQDSATEMFATQFKEKFDINNFFKDSNKPLATRQQIDELLRSKMIGGFTQNLGKELFASYLKNHSLEDTQDSRDNFAKDVGLVFNKLTNRWEPADNKMYQRLMFLDSIAREINENMLTDPEYQKTVGYQFYDKMLKEYAGFLELYIKQSRGLVGSPVLNAQEGQYVGFVNGKFSDKFDQQITKEILSYKQKAKRFRDAGENEFAKIADKQVDKLIDLKKEYYKAVVVHNMIETLSNPSNITRIAKPISTAVFNSQDSEGNYTEGSVFAELEKAGRLSNLDYDVSSPMGGYQSLRSVSDGLRLVGIYANFIKVYAYMNRSGATPSMLAELKTIEKLARELNSNKEYKPETRVRKKAELQRAHDTLRLLMKNAMETDTSANDKSLPAFRNIHFKYIPQEGEAILRDVMGLQENSMVTGAVILDVLDTLVNVAIDNVKEQILPQINAFASTSTIIPSLISLGLPLRDVVMINTSPFMVSLTQDPSIRSQKDLIEKLKGYKVAIEKKLTTIESPTDTKVEEVTTDEVDNTEEVSEEETTKKAKVKRVRSFDAGTVTANSKAYMPTEEFKGYTIQDLAAPKVEDELLIRDLLDLIIKASEMGEAFSTVSSALNTLRDTPTTIEEMDRAYNAISEVVDPNKLMPTKVDEVTAEEMTLEEYEKSLEQVLDAPVSTLGKMYFPMFFARNPHIYFAFQTFVEMYNNLKDKFIMQSDIVREMAQSIPLKFSSRKEENQALIRKEISKFLTTQALPDWINDERGVLRLNTGKSGIEQHGTAAFTTNFVQTVKKILDFYVKEKEAGRVPPNAFLDNLVVTKRDSGFFDIKFTSGGLLSPSEIYFIKKDFLALKKYEVEFNENGSYKSVTYNEDATVDHTYTPFQERFYMYSTLRYGFDISPSNYSYVLPSSLYSQFGKKVDEIFKEFKDNADFRKNIKDLITVQLMRENADAAPKLQMDGLEIEDITKVTDLDSKKGSKSSFSNTKGVVNLNGIDYHYDRAYTGTPTKKLSEREKMDGDFYPRFIQVGRGATLRVYMRINQARPGEKVYYQDIGYRKRSYQIVDLNPYMVGNEKYDISKTYDPTIRHVYVSTLDQEQLSANFNLDYVIEKDLAIQVGLYSDVERTNVRFAKLEKISEDKGRFTYKLTYLEDVTSNPNPRAPRVSLPQSEINAAQASQSGSLVDTEYPDKVTKGGKVFNKTAPIKPGRYTATELIQNYFLAVASKYEKNLLLQLLKNRDLSSIKVDVIPNALFDKGTTNTIAGSVTLIETRTSVISTPITLPMYTQSGTGQSVEDTTSTFLEELIHAITAPEIYTNKELKSYLRSIVKSFKENKTTLVDNFKRKLNSLENVEDILDPSKDTRRLILLKLGRTAEEYQQNSNLQQEVRDFLVNMSVVNGLEYSFSNELELGARTFADPITRLFLQSHSIDQYGNIKPVTTEPTLWDNIMNIIKTIMSSIGIQGSLYESISGAMMDALMNRPFTTLSDGRTDLKTTVVKLFSVKQNIDDTTESTDGSTKQPLIPNANPHGYKKDENDDTGRYFSGARSPLNAVSDAVEGGISWFRKKITGYTDSVTIADKLWENRLKTDKIMTNFGLVTYDEFIEKRDNEYMLKGRNKGKISHLLLQGLIDKGSAATEQAVKMMDQVGMKAEAFDWITKSFNQIMVRAGINTFARGVKNPDLLESEVTIANDDLQIAGTIDLVSKHNDGTYSFYDFKTTLKLMNDTFVEAFKYGANGKASRTIYDNPLNRAKLQLMLYAVLAKAANPDMKFRNLSVLWLNNQKTLYSRNYKNDIDVPGFLSMVEHVLKTTKSEELKAVKARMGEQAFAKLFDPKEYAHSIRSSPTLASQVLESKGDFKTLMDLKTAQLRELTIEYSRMTNPDINKKYDQEVVDKIRLLSKEIMELKGKYVGLDTSGWSNDIGFLGLWLNSFSDSASPILQMMSKEATERRTRALQRYDEAHTKFRSLLLPIYNAYLQSTNQAAVKTLTGGMLNRVDSQALYGPMLVATKDADGVSINHRFKTVDEINKMDISPQMKQYYINFVTYVTEQYSQFFEGPQALANKVVYKEELYPGKIKEYTVMDVHNGALLPFAERSANKNLFQFDKKNFFPKVPPHMSEMGLKTAAKELWSRNMTFYHEVQYDRIGRDTHGLPIKYISTSYDANYLYSINIENQFDKFMRNMFLKEELDDLLFLAKGVRTALESEKVAPNTMLELDRFVDQSVLGYSSKIADEYSKDSKRLASFHKIVETNSKFATYAILGGKVVSATFNALQQYLRMLLEASRNSISIKTGLAGTTGTPFDFTMKDMIWAHRRVWSEKEGGVFRDMMTGNLHNNKYYRIAKQLGYFPDSFTRMTDHSKHLTASFKLLNPQHAMALYSLPEQMLAMYTMLAQLNHIKVASGPMKGQPLHEMYELNTYKDENGNDYTKLEWKKDEKGNPYVRAKRRVAGLGEDGYSYEDITEITPEEKEVLYSVYSKYAGGYREDERTRLDYYFLGKAFVQFKRYLPNILVTGGMSSGQRIKYGHWETLTDPANPDVATVEWNSAVMEGRAVVMYKLASSWLGVKMKAHPDPGNSALLKSYNLMVEGFNPKHAEEYKWENLSPRQKEAAVDMLLTLAVWTAMFVGALALFGGQGDDDDDWANFNEKDPMYRGYRRVMRDVTQFWNGYELSKNLFKNATPASWGSFGNTVMSTTDMTFALLSGNRNQDGSLPGWKTLANGIPALSAYRDMSRFLEQMEILEDRQPTR